MTGLALLAFICAGYSDLSQDKLEGIQVGPVVKKGATWLESRLATKQAGSPVPFPDKVVGSLALLELYSLTGSLAWREVAEKAATFTLKETPKSEWGRIWKGLLSKAAAFADIGKGPGHELGRLSRDLKAMPSITSQAGALLLATWGQGKQEKKKASDLLSWDAGSLPAPVLSIVTQGSYTRGDHGPWHEWFRKQKANLIHTQDLEGHSAGSWAGTATATRIEGTSFRILALTHYRCWTCRNVFGEK